MSKPQRIRDPLHDLIEFDESDFEQNVWSLIDTREFQRLRRIKQLGFSEFVYPGATHNRLSHSIGVFHTARRLAKLIEIRTGSADKDRVQIALVAALVHDVGHGPFSHAFESALKKLDKLFEKKQASRHEVWTSEIIEKETELGLGIKNRFGEEFRKFTSSLLLQETPTDIYSSIVSSQFDADRLDYIRRDPLMTGAKSGQFDFSWLMANLEVGKVPFSTDDETYAEVDSLILGHKAFQAAEAYVLGLFHLYFTVYFHKATRSAEKMLSALIVRTGQLFLTNETHKTGMAENGPLIDFIKHRTLESYLRLDDAVVWGEISMMTQASDVVTKDISSRLLRRDLYKAIDISSTFRGRGNEAGVAKFRAKLTAAKKAKTFDEFEIFEDSPKRSPYKVRGYDTPEALAKVLIRKSSGTDFDDLASMSDVVKALQEKTIYRVYVRDKCAYSKIESLIAEVD